MDLGISSDRTYNSFSTVYPSNTSVEGCFGQRKTTEWSTDSAFRNRRTSPDLLSKPNLKDRLVYPLKAFRNRMYTTMLTGGSAGVFLGLGIGSAAGATAGFTVGLIPQALDLLTFSCEPYVIAGALIGKEVGIRGGAVLGLGIGAVSALASVAIGLALSVVHLSRDIYHAATLDKPSLDAPLPEKPWIAQKLSQELSKLK